MRRSSSVISPVLSVMVFGTEYCPPCKIVKSLLNNLSDSRSDFELSFIDTEDNPKFTVANSVQSAPTVLFFVNGSEVDRLIGLQGLEVFQDRISKWAS